MLPDEPTLRPGLFQMPEKPIGPRVLIPAFRQATSVRGGFGWFSASWIARLAPGLAVYLNREDVAPIHFTVSPWFFPKEKEAAETTLAMTAEEAADRVRAVFVEGKATATALASHALDCLAWMLATNRLTLNVAVPYSWSNYHPKLWLFEDGDNRVIVRGSGNATGRGVYAGVEHMDVDVSWDRFSSDRVSVGVKMLRSWESGKSSGIASVFSLPEAIEREIIEQAPNSAPTSHAYVHAAVREGRPTYAISPGLEGSLTPPAWRSRTSRRLVIPEFLNWTDPPYSHQEEAVAAWEAGVGGDSAEQGILAMATGAGKTITALICAARAQDRRHDRPFVVVISAPSTPLLRQWEGEVRAFGIEPTVPTLHAKGTTFALTQSFRRMLGGGTEVLIVTNNLLCTREFQDALQQAVSAAEAVPMLIGDEAHSLGSAGFLTRTPDFFELRLGLSATPERQYDPDGTEELFSYFGSTVYEFGLGEAIGFCLVPYSYHVHAATLNGSELDEFAKLSKQIGAKFSDDAGVDPDQLTRLLIKRRRIVETAASKIDLLHRVLLSRDPKRIRHALVYASSKNPEQFEMIKNVLDDLQIVYAPVTQHETSHPDQLATTLRAFQNGEIRVLLAKRVLDEGVDIPAIREAFVVASSTVEREWVQRRGRILRMTPGKTSAILHDFLALPPAEYLSDSSADSIKKSVANELGRATTFASHAKNAAGARGAMAQIASIRSAYWNSERTTNPVLQHEGSWVTAPDTPDGAVQ